MQSTNDLIGTAEVADIFGVDSSTITRWVQAGKLEPAFKLPGLLLFERTAILERAAS